MIIVPDMLTAQMIQWCWHNPGATYDSASAERLFRVRTTASTLHRIGDLRPCSLYQCTPGNRTPSRRSLSRVLRLIPTSWQRIVVLRYCLDIAAQEANAKDMLVEYCRMGCRSEIALNQFFPFVALSSSKMYVGRMYVKPQKNLFLAVFRCYC